MEKDKFLTGVIGIILVIILWCFSSCKTIKVVPVTNDSIRIEYRNRDILRFDSIYIREKDSVYIEKSGDSIKEFRGKEIVLYRDREIHDTVNVEITKEVEKEIPVYVEVEKKLSWYDKVSLKIGKWIIPILLLLLIIMAMYFAVRNSFKHKKD